MAEDQQDHIAKQVTGYAILKQPHIDIVAWESWHAAEKRYGVGGFQSELRRFRDALEFIIPEHYRGTGRTPLEPFLSIDSKKIEMHRRESIDIETEAIARFRYKELIGDELFPD